MRQKVCEVLCLDSAGSDGLTAEVSQVLSMDGMNGLQAELVVYVFSATTLDVITSLARKLINRLSVESTLGLLSVS